MASVEITDPLTETSFFARSKNLNLFGCFVETPKPLPKGAQVRLRIFDAGKHFFAQGQVAFSRPNVGMGIGFTSIEASSLPVLGAWLAQLREHLQPFPASQDADAPGTPDAPKTNPKV